MRTRSRLVFSSDECTRFWPKSNTLPARIAKVEFLGAFCLVGLNMEGRGLPALVANVPRHEVEGGGIGYVEWRYDEQSNALTTTEPLHQFQPRHPGEQRPANGEQRDQQ